jgi:uncharacterized protein YjbI with pentapeptide repeats
MDRLWVRPRFTDGSFDEPLLLDEHFEESFLGAAGPRQLLLAGTRGSGLTTALGILAQLARSRGREALSADELFQLEPLAARRRLEGKGAILFADLSVTPLGRDELLLRVLGPAFLRSHDVVVCGTRLGPLLRWTRIDEEALVHLAPWGRDELLELLSTEAYREERARLHTGLARLDAGLLSRPRTARWIVDAAMRLEEGEPFTRSRLFANVLDELTPGAIALAKRGARLEVGEVQLEKEELESVLTVFDVDPRAAHAIRENRRPRMAPPALALEGLHDFLRAGAVIKSVAEDVAPAALDRAVLPFTVEMMTPALEERLWSWLGGDFPKPASAATLLHALRRKLVIAKTRSIDLTGAILSDADLRGAPLERAMLTNAFVDGARLDDAVLKNAFLQGLDGSAASFERADMRDCDLTGAQLYGASLRGANLGGAVIVNAGFEGASFEEALLERAAITHSYLDRADFTNARLQQAHLGAVQVAGADFTGADLAEARLEVLDLRETRFAPLRATRAKFENTRLSELDLSGLLASGAIFKCCELSGTILRGAHLENASFFVRAHDAVFDEAKLERALFSKCNFHAGSSRAGLLLGKPALEGNMTGYYNEGTTDDQWASPDSIRVASFRGADLRGARFVDTDLFRVDFRGATMDPELRAEAIKQGAIVD